MAETLSLNLLMGAVHCLLPAVGPKKKPKYFAEDFMEKFAQAGICLSSQALMPRVTSGLIGMRGMIMHFMGLRVRPANF
jgi:hypothetical protein